MNGDRDANSRPENERETLSGGKHEGRVKTEGIWIALIGRSGCRPHRSSFLRSSSMLALRRAARWRVVIQIQFMVLWTV